MEDDLKKEFYSTSLTQRVVFFSDVQSLHPIPSSMNWFWSAFLSGGTKQKLIYKLHRLSSDHLCI